MEPSAPADWMGLYGVERQVGALLGACALAGLGVLAWMGRQPARSMAGGSAAVHAAAWDGALERARRVDVNTAPVAELERLPQVGPGLARRIAAYRQAHGPFGAPEELRRVQGIGPKTYEAIQDVVTVD